MDNNDGKKQQEPFIWKSKTEAELVPLDPHIVNRAQKKTVWPGQLSQWNAQRQWRNKGVMYPAPDLRRKCKLDSAMQQVLLETEEKTSRLRRELADLEQQGSSDTRTQEREDSPQPPSISGQAGETLATSSRDGESTSTATISAMQQALQASSAEFYRDMQVYLYGPPPSSGSSGPGAA